MKRKFLGKRQWRLGYHKSNLTSVFHSVKTHLIFLFRSMKFQRISVTEMTISFPMVRYFLWSFIYSLENNYILIQLEKSILQRYTLLIFFFNKHGELKTLVSLTLSFSQVIGDRLIMNKSIRNSQFSFQPLCLCVIVLIIIYGNKEALAESVLFNTLIKMVAQFYEY